jgi:hypothetical protein
VPAFLRVARLDGSALKSLADNQQDLFDNFDALTRLIRRHLPPITASLFAKPSTTDGATVEWYSDLAGQPTPISALPAPEQEAVRQILADRLQSVTTLANELPRIDPDAADLGPALRQAVSYPGDQYVYAVGGQPVITFWGHEDQAAHAARVSAAAAAAELTPAAAATGTKPRRFSYAWLAVPALLLVAAALGWWYWSQQKEALRADLLVQLEAAQGDCARIWALTGRLAQADPDGARYPGLRARVDAEMARCRLAEEFSQRLAAAGGDCAELQTLAADLGQHDTDRTPLREIRLRLDTELETCRLAADLEQRLAAASGDCARLQELAKALEDPDTATPLFQPLRSRLSTELEKCQLAVNLAQQLDLADGDCGRLTAIEAGLQGQSTDNAALREVRSELDAGLAKCREAAELAQALADAKGDCKRLAALDKTLRGRGTDAEPLRTIRNELSAELEKCRIIAELERRFKAAGADCRQLEKLDRAMAAQQIEPDRLRTIRNGLDTALAECRKPKPVAEAKPPEPPKRQDKPKAAEPPTPSKPPKPVDRAKAVDPLKLCPDERPPELAPDLVIVFDASGSMGEKIPRDPQAERQMERQLGPFGAVMNKVMRDLDPSLPRRIDVAKKATRGIVNELPNDVDIGLVLVENCPRARQVGFFPPNQRGKLLRQIGGITPVRKTPLGSGIAQAGKMVDGVNAPGIVVVVSDGEESCGTNPCAVARRLARQKPRLIINVVDIMGTGAGNCLAQQTKGRVYTATNAEAFKTMLRRATQEARGPANCK